MTVINVTNATLQGTFTGSITYADVVPTPIPTPIPTPVPTPVPPINTRGKITNFKPNTAQVWQIEEKDVVNQNASKSWSLTQVDEYAVRCEVRKGDLWANSSYNDAGNNRNEISYGNLNGSTNFPEGVQLNLSMNVTINPGPVNTAGWCDICQLHAVVNTPPSPFYINLDKGDYLSVIVQSPSVSWKSIYKSPQPVVRGKAYDIRAEVMMKPAGGGYARVWIDGVQVTNYVGAIGATNSQYWWKFGLYRGDVPETLSAVFRNVALTGPTG